MLFPRRCINLHGEIFDFVVWLAYQSTRPWSISSVSNRLATYLYFTISRSLLAWVTVTESESGLCTAPFLCFQCSFLWAICTVSERLPYCLLDKVLSPLGMNQIEKSHLLEEILSGSARS